MPPHTHPDRLSILLVVGIISIGGIIFYKYLKKMKRRYLFWRETPIHICTSTEDWMKNEKHFLDAFYKTGVIGLDCEWVNSDGNRRPVSLLQIATSSKICVVFQMTSFMKEPALPSSLTHLLEDSSVLKVGVEVSEDVQKLHKDYGIIVKGFCDLRFIADSIPDLQDIETKSLKDLAKNVAGIEISKFSWLRCSNWEAEVLTEEQISYAAGDAIVAAVIFDALIRKICPTRCMQKTSSDSPLEKEELSLIHRFADIPYSALRSSPNKVISQCKVTMKEKRPKKYAAVRQRPLYDNCLLVAPDGEHLAVCNLRKIQWYLEKDLGEIISQEPLTLRLKFEPADRPILDREYYLYEKDNCCVVCGTMGSLQKKYVVPNEYKRFFPGIMKDHLSHDILLLCVSCHQRSNIYDLFLRRQLANECCAPLGSAQNVRLKEQPRLQKVKSAARAILRYKEKLPNHRLKELKKIVADFCDVMEMTEDILLIASKMETSFINEEYVLHGERVVDYMCRHDGLLAFESRWRQYFLDSMKPEYLPKLWSVTHSHEWFALKVIEGNLDFDPGILGLSEEQLDAAAHNKYFIEGKKRASATV